MIQNIANKIEKSYPLIKARGNDIQKTLYFKVGKKDILPGQFFMLNYNVCQKPFSVSHYDGEVVGFTIQDRGECSRNMINAAPGEYFGLTGPLGNVFDVASHETFLVIGGGIGTAPVYYLTDYLLKQGKKVDVLFGGRSKDNIDYIEDLNTRDGCRMRLYTDDGSMGNKGFVTKDLDTLLAENTYDTVCLCGPEKMMAIVIEQINGKTESIQVCMERYMKCGIGLCGSCVLDDIGMRVCAEGPVFDYTKYLKLSREFGVYHRTGSGVIEKF